MRIRGLISIFIIFILFLISITGCIFDNDDKNEKDIICTYHVKIENTNTNYTIIIPLPINENNYVKEIIDSLEIIKGKGIFEVTNTSYGRDKYGLKIVSDSNIELKSMTNIKTLYHLSLENRSDIDSAWYDDNPNWIVILNSSQMTPIELEIRYEVDRYYSMDGYFVSGNVYNGLNYIEGKTLKRED